MTPDQVREARLKLGLTQTQLAKRLRMKGNGARQIRAWESGEAQITGPASLAIEYMLKEIENDRSKADAGAVAGEPH